MDHFLLLKFFLLIKFGIFFIRKLEIQKLNESDPVYLLIQQVKNNRSESTRDHTFKDDAANQKLRRRPYTQTHDTCFLNAFRDPAIIPESS